MKGTFLFRQAALDRISSPEQLDRLMQVTRPRSWIALAGIGAALVGALVWGVLGRVPDKVTGQGILLKQGGLFRVEAKAAGVVQDLRVSVGSDLARDQVIARLFQPEVEENLRQERARLSELQRSQRVTTGLVVQNQQLELDSLAQQLRHLRQGMDAARARIAYLEGRLGGQAELRQAGLITTDAYQATVQELAAARDELTGAEAQAKQLEARQSALRTQASQTVFSLEQATSDATRRLEQLQAQLRETAEIRAPHAGRVLELLSTEGAQVTRGDSLVMAEMAEAPLRGAVFVAAGATRIRPGQSVQISPSGVAWEEHGYLLGRVVEVSRNPLSPTAMNVFLRNDALVRQFTAEGATYLVSVELLADPGTRSGFRWTSRGGPDLGFGSGTLCTAQIAVRERRPIALVIPALRKWLGI
jgi:HlyD family secretion protein